MEKLNIFYWNCASGIVKKIDFIKQTIRDKGAHIFFIAEAEVPLGMDLGVFRIAGYDLVCAKTIQSREKARLICYVKQNMFQQMEDTLNPYNDIIMLTHKNLTIVGLYRGFKLHENENDRSNWLRLMSDLNSVITSNEVFIVGDLNVDVSKLKSRNSLVKMIGVNHLEDIMFLRSSLFLFNIIFYMVPTDLVYKLLGKSYFNDRNLGKLHFFDCSNSRIGKACITNCAGSLSSKWTFDWFLLTPELFKTRLKNQISNSYI